MTFDTLGLSADLVQLSQKRGTTTPTPVQAARSPSSSGSRRPRRRADRNRQDRRVRAADPRPPARQGQYQVLAGAPSGPRAHPGAHPRTGDAGGRERPHLRPDRAAALGVVYGGVPIDPQTKALRGRRRDPRRDAGPAAGPHRPARRRTSARSRSSSSTRPTGCSTWASCRTSAASSTCSPPAAEPAVLGHVPG